MFNKGLKEQYYFLTHKVGEFANTYINLSQAYANLHMILPLYHDSDNENISLSFYYSLFDCNVLSICGKGTSLNLYRKLEKRTDEKIYVTNPDGSIDTYIKGGGKRNTYINGQTQCVVEDNYNSIEPYESKMVFIDKNKTRYIYSYFCLSYPEEIDFPNGTYITLSVSSSPGTARIDAIDDHDKTKIYFEYLNDLLSIIKIKKNNITVYEIMLSYDTQSRLTNIIYKKGVTAFAKYVYSFDIDNHQIMVQDAITKYRIKYNIENGRVISFKDGYDEKLTKGQETKITYQSSNTTVTYYNGLTNIVFFNNEGYPIFDVDPLKRVRNYKYDGSKVVEKSFYQVNQSTYVKEHSLFQNPLFQEEMTFWRVNGNGRIKVNTIQNQLLQEIIGTHVLDVSGDNSPVSIRQKVSIVGNIGDEMVFGIWMKNCYFPNTTLDSLVNFKLYIYNGTTMIDTKSYNVSNKEFGASSNWNYITFAFQAPSFYTAIELEIIVYELETWVYFTSVQLYKKTYGALYQYNNEGDRIGKVVGGTHSTIQYYETDTVYRDLMSQITKDGTIYAMKYNNKRGIVEMQTNGEVRILQKYDEKGRVVQKQTLDIQGEGYNIQTKYDSVEAVSAPYYQMQVTNENSSKTTYCFDKIYHQLKYLEYMNENNIIRKENERDALGNIIQSILSYKIWNPEDETITSPLEENEEKILYTYNEQNQLTSIETEYTYGYYYSYDSLGRLSEIKIGPLYNEEEGNLAIPLKRYTYVEDKTIDNTAMVYTNKIATCHSTLDGYTYKINYDIYDRISSIQKKEVTETEYTTCLTYVYNEAGLLKQSIDVQTNYIQNYHYNLNHQLIEMNDNDENKITYQYDNLGNVCAKSYTTKEETIEQSYSSFAKSLGVNAKTYFEGVKYSKTNEHTYSCFFTEDCVLQYNEKDKTNNYIPKKITPFTEVNIERNRENRLPIVEYKKVGNKNILAYLIPAEKEEKGIEQSISIWIKPDNINQIEDEFIFIVTEKNILTTKADKNTILVRKKGSNIYLDIRDNQGVIHTIQSSCLIDNTKWNFVSASWKFTPNADSILCEAKLMVNGYFNYLTENWTNTTVLLGKEAILSIGGIYFPLISVCNFISKFTGLMVSDGFMKKDYQITQDFMSSKEYVFDSVQYNEDIETIYHSESNLYSALGNEELFKTFDVIPLNQSLLSVNGTAPYDLTKRKTVDFDIERSFAYDDKIKRNAYISDGASLIYDFNFGNIGTIALKMKIRGYRKAQYIFHNNAINATTPTNFGLAMFTDTLTTRIYIVTDQRTYATPLFIQRDQWHFISMSWQKVITSDSVASSRFNIKVMLDNEVYETDIEWNIITNPHFITYIGSYSRKPNEVEDIKNHPLLSFIEMVSHRNVYATNATLQQLKVALSTVSFTKQYDALHRMKKKIWSMNGEDTSKQIYEYFASRVIGEKLVESYQDSSPSTIIEKEYTYDDVGNIVHIVGKKNGVIISNNSYTYDYKNNLTSETYNGNLYTYSYTKLGDIESVVVKNIENPDIEVLGGKTYKYENVVIGATNFNRLIRVGKTGIAEATTILYESENPWYPSSYIVNGKKISCIWSGGNLVEQDSEDWNIVYQYNGLRQRVKKKVYYKKKNSTIETNYYYEGDKLVHEVRGNNSIYYIYDEANELYAMKYNHEYYYYVYDICHNIVRLINKTTNRIEYLYEYNAYGENLLTVHEEDVNPFRYKGYYYDIETGLYWVSLRYYSPEWGRFIQPADVSSLNPSSINGLNLYAYCGNDPINLINPTPNSSSNGMYSNFSTSQTTGSTGGGGLSLPQLPWVISNGTSIYGTYATLSTAISVTPFLFRYGKTFADEMKLYGISNSKGALALSGFNWGIGKADGIMMGIDVGLDIYDSIQRGVSAGGVILGAGLTLGKDVALLYADKGIMWTCTTVGSFVGPIGTAVGFVVGVGICIFVDWKIGDWISDWIDSIVK